MRKRKKAKKVSASQAAEQSEKAMIGGILEGSPDAVGVAVLRLECGCRKMAALDRKGEPASKVIMYRDNAESICDRCKADHGHVSRVRFQFIHWDDETLSEGERQRLSGKVLGHHPTSH